jgi:Tol biopolymer transport system component
MRAIRVVMTSVLLATVLVATGRSAFATDPGANGLIAFGRISVRRADLMAVQPDGSGTTNLTHAIPGGWFEGAWSPDGSRLAIVGYPGRHTALITLNADGTGATTLTREIGRHGVNFASPTWSPDGAQIAFCVLNQRFTVSRIYVIGADGTGRTAISPKGILACDPSWSADGVIAFDITHGRHHDIATMAPDGSNVLTLVSGGRDLTPDWSPDGGTIVFSCDAEVCNVPADGGDVTTVLSSKGKEYDPVFSPDGTEIAFVRHKGHDFGTDLWVMQTDGTGAHRLTNYSSRYIVNGTNWQPIVP